MKHIERVKCYGEYKVSLIRGGEVIKEVENSNTFTNVGYKEIYGGEATNSNRTVALLLGEGNEEITQGDTALGDQISSTTITNNTTTHDEEIDDKLYTKIVITKNYSEGEVSGNISEIGLGFDNTFVCGQLLRDEQNSPTTIPVTNEDQLFITYTIYIQQFKEEEIYTENIDGTQVIISRLNHSPVTRSAGTSMRSNINPVYYYRINSGSRIRPSETITNYTNRIERNLGFSVSAGTSDQTFNTIIFDSYTNSQMRGDTFRIEFDPPLLKDKDDKFTINFNLVTQWDD